MSINLCHHTKEVNLAIPLTASKSESNRALIIQALCDNHFEISNLAEAKDTKVLKTLLETFNQQKILDVGHAGTVMRFLTAFLCLQKGEYILTGSERMKQRPIKILVNALKTLGARIEYIEKEGYPPLKISDSKMQGGIIQIDGNVSSQYISALLMIAPLLKNGLIIAFKGEIISKPYVNMTVNIMKYFDTKINWVNNTIEVKSGKYKAKNFVIEADWSAASYWYSIASLSNKSNIQLFGLKKNSLQGDAAIQHIYKNFGVKTRFTKNGILLSKTLKLKINSSLLEINFEDYPDIAQTIAVTCASLNIPAKLTGLKTLRIKETDRILALKTELNKLGFHITVENDDILIDCHFGENNDLSLTNQPIKTYNDHRMAMAFAPLALLNNIIIEDQDVVVKSYPNFWNDLKKAAFSIKKIK